MSSGGSRAANRLGIASVAFLGRGGGAALPLATLALVVPHHDTARIQEAHRVFAALPDGPYRGSVCLSEGEPSARDREGTNSASQTLSLARRSRLWPPMVQLAAPAALACDVLVYGSTTGQFAAVEAGGELHVLLACPQTHLGGMAASGLSTTDAVRTNVLAARC
jgi:hypothetical protein